MIDSHTHLDRLPIAVGAAVERARAAGVKRLLTVGTDPGSCRAALEAAERLEGVRAAVGMHPHGAADFHEDAARELDEMASHPLCAAIGETGLDYFRDRAPAADQQRAFEHHIGLARRVGKPVVIHAREADDDTLETLARQADGVQVLLHCFSMPSRLEECLDRGYWLSFAGNVTYPRNPELAEAAARAPLERLLVETDAPYLTPQKFRKEPNEPAFVTHTARFVAERRGISYAELEAAVEANAARLFGW